MNKKHIYKFNVYNTEDGYLIAESKYLNINIQLTNKTFNINKKCYKIKSLPKKYKNLYEYLLLQIKLLNLEIPYYLEPYQGSFTRYNFSNFNGTFKIYHTIMRQNIVRYLFKYKYKRYNKILNLENSISSIVFNWSLINTKIIKNNTSFIDIINKFFIINDFSKYTEKVYKNKKEEN